MKIAVLQLPQGTRYSHQQINQIGTILQNHLGDEFKVTVLQDGAALSFPEEQAQAITDMAASLSRIESLLDSCITSGRMLTRESEFS